MNQNNSAVVLKEFFKLSVLSGFITVLCGIIAVGSALFLIVLRQGELSTYYDQIFSRQINTPEQIRILTEELNRSTFAADSSVFVFWMIIGLFVYILGEIAFKFISGGTSFFEEMNHTIPSHRATLFAVAIQHVLLRLLGVVGLYVLYILSLKLIPITAYFVYWLQGYDRIISIIVLLAFSSVIGCLIAYWITLCLRLVMYRVRIFGFTGTLE